MKVLCVIDMQNDFIDGALGTKEAAAIVENVKAKIELYRKNGDTVIFTRDTHSEDYMNTQEGKNLPVPHCIKGSKGWEVSEKLDTASDKIIDKPTFGWMHWNEERLENVEIVGLCTDICVVTNALIIKTQFPEANITVIADCCAGVTPETHDAALKTMAMCQINITE